MGRQGLRPCTCRSQSNGNSNSNGGLPEGWRGGSGCGGRCKYVHVSSVAACSCALSCAHGKTGVGRPAQPARGVPRAHAAHAPAPGPTPPSTDFRDLSLIHTMRGCSSNSIRNIRFVWRIIHAWRGSTRHEESVRGGAVSECGVSAAWMRLPSLQGRTCSVPALRHRPAIPRIARCCCCFCCCWGCRPAAGTTMGLPASGRHYGCRAAGPAAQPHYLAAAICFSMSAAVTGPRKVCASLPCGSSRCVSGRPRGVAKSAGGSNGSTITIG